MHPFHSLTPILFHISIAKLVHNKRRVWVWIWAAHLRFWIQFLQDLWVKENGSVGRAGKRCRLLLSRVHRTPTKHTSDSAALLSTFHATHILFFCYHCFQLLILPASFPWSVFDVLVEKSRWSEQGRERELFTQTCFLPLRHCSILPFHGVCLCVWMGGVLCSFWPCKVQNNNKYKHHIKNAEKVQGLGALSLVWAPAFLPSFLPQLQLQKNKDVHIKQRVGHCSAGLLFGCCPDR